ncbi:MAG: electron transport complex subunit E [Oscillospiraceae bacterium]
MEKKSNLSVLVNGIIKENPVLVLVLGTCPSIAVTTSATNAIGMGIAATVVLLGSNVVISMLKSIIPDKVRIPCYIVVIATFVSVVQLLLQAYAISLYNALGVFLPLIVVNCIILGRAEMFANKNGVVASAMDGIGMGLGFTLALLIISTIREVIGAGTWFGLSLGITTPISVFTAAPGGFLIFGCTIALVNYLTKGRVAHKAEFGCGSCPNAGSCHEGGCN